MWTGSHSRPLPAPVAVTDARAAYSLQLSRPSPARAVGKAAEHPETMDSPFSGKSASASKEPREGSDSPDPPTNVAITTQATTS
ncbi:Complement C3 [Dissostichus eleginoides]|uniref:Complement C3 n=1 Tax=Dissostichus eleginoides TaxID=100907 RepID=A0AAD9B9J7_DISEL|nr:Complement C3 [Dissostichus eleginoides]